MGDWREHRGDTKENFMILIRFGETARRRRSENEDRKSKEFFLPIREC